MAKWARVLVAAALTIVSVVCALLTLAGVEVIATNGEVMSADSVSAVDWLETASFGFVTIGLAVWVWRLIR